MEQYDRDSLSDTKLDMAFKAAMVSRKAFGMFEIDMEAMLETVKTVLVECCKHSQTNRGLIAHVMFDSETGKIFEYCTRDSMWKPKPIEVGLVGVLNFPEKWNKSVYDILYNKARRALKLSVVEITGAKLLADSKLKNMLG